MDDDSTTGEDNLDENQDLEPTGDENANDSTNLDDTSTDDNDSEEQSDDDDSDSDDNDSDESDASEFDEDLDEWAEKTHRAVPENDDDREVLQKLRDSQRDYTKAQQAKKANDALNETVATNKPEDKSKTDDADPLAARLDRLEAEKNEEKAIRLRSEYLLGQNVTDEEVTAMGDLLKEKIEKASTDEEKLAVHKFWTDPKNLEDWHALAKAKLARPVDTTAIEEAAAKKTRERIAKESKANGSNRNASTTSTSDKTLEQERLERFKNWDGDKKK